MEKCSADGCNKSKRGSTRFCSRHAEQMRKYKKIISVKPTRLDPNEILIKGDIAEIVLRDSQGNDIAVAVIDANKVELVNDKKWYLTSHGYCASRMKSGSHYLHRLVSGNSSKQIDHIDGDKLNNRVSNLRGCTASQNLANTAHRKNNSTGVKGVHRFKGGDKFAAQITKNRKVYCLGVYKTIEEAAKAYEVKAKELFGEFANTSVRGACAPCRDKYKRG